MMTLGSQDINFHPPTRYKYVFYTAIPFLFVALVYVDTQLLTVGYDEL